MYHIVYEINWSIQMNSKDIRLSTTGKYSWLGPVTFCNILEIDIEIPMAWKSKYKIIIISYFNE